MALTRKFLSALSIDEEKIDEIITAHTETVNGLKDKIADAEEKAKTADELQGKLDEALKKLEASEKDDGYKEKYESLEKEFNEYKDKIDATELARKKDVAYRELLKRAGVSDKRYDAIMKVTSLDDIELDGDSIKDADKVVENIIGEWNDFIVTEKQKGAKTDNPPANNGSGATMTREQIRNIKDPAERQQKMIENATLFGLE